MLTRRSSRGRLRGGPAGWPQDRGDLDITTNQWVSDPWPTKLQRIAYAQSRGPGCFDNHYYLQKNADLKVIPNALELWNHFVLHGQFEGRSHRCARPSWPLRRALCAVAAP